MLELELKLLSSKNSHLVGAKTSLFEVNHLQLMRVDKKKKLSNLALTPMFYFIGFLSAVTVAASM